MKYLNKLFSFKEEDQVAKNASSPPSLTLTSSLYSVTFIAEDYLNTRRRTLIGGVESEVDLTNQISIVAHRGGGGDGVGGEIDKRQLESTRSVRCVAFDKKHTRRLDGLGGFLLTATIGKSESDTSAITPAAGSGLRDLCDDIQDEIFPIEKENNLDSEEDWILVDVSNVSTPSSSPIATTATTTTTTTTTKQKGVNREERFKRKKKVCESLIVNERQKEEEKLKQMALDKTDVELIKASWIPVRRNPVAEGVLLFKGLFTKFPQYLKFFPHFADLDIENMQENKRLVRHATKVIETVSLVVDAIGDETLVSQLNEALVNLVVSHLKKKIGLSEFRNLGIVLIDFICDINNRRSSVGADGACLSRQQHDSHQLNSSSTSDSINHSSNDDSETMTSALDKVRTSSSPSSSSEEENYLGGGGVVGGGQSQPNSSGHKKEQVDEFASGLAANNETKIDTNALVAAWTKLYSSILDLVKREEEKASSN